MKKVIVMYVRDSGDYSIEGVFNDYQNAMKSFTQNVKSFLSMGPDDYITYHLDEINLKNSDYDKLMKVLEDDKFYDIQEFLSSVLENNHRCKPLCWESNSGNIEIVELYMKDNDISEDEDDEEDWYEYVWNNDDIYSKYLDKYVAQTFGTY